MSPAASWKPSGSPAAANVAAISSISPTKRHAFLILAATARSERPVASGCERAHSASSAASTPSWTASARIASSSACEPFVQAAYAILIADAAPIGPSSTTASSAVPLKRAATASAPGPDKYSRVLPAFRGGGPMIPPSTKRAPPAATISPTSRVVAGAIALPSTNVPPNRVPATSRATSGAFAGGQTDRMISLSRASRVSVPTSSSPSASARVRVADPRPADAQITRAPAARAAAPTALPISPGCRIPIVVTPASSRCSLRRPARTAKQAARPLGRLHETAGQQQHDGDEERAENQQVNVDPAEREVFLQRDVQHRAEHGALQRADAADEGHQQRVERPLRPEWMRRVIADVIEREQPAGQARERGRQRERQELQRQRADSGGLRGRLVLADRAHAEPHAR